LPLRVALATAAAIEHGCDQTVGVKWPNDLLIGGRKVGGILCEGAWETGELRYVVIGIGLNLLHSWEDFPPEIRGTATSLRQASSQAISRFETASRVIEGLRREVLGGSRTEGLPRDLGGRDVLRSRRVEVLEPETGRVLAQGIADGIGPDGALLLWNASGSTEVRSGTI